MNERRNVPEIVIAIPRIASQIPNSDQSPLYDVRNPARPSDKDATCEVMFRGRLFWLDSRAARLRSSSFDAAAFAKIGLPSRSWRSQRRLVEPDGIEPTTSCLQSTRSPS
jgi:hypothetical protein